MNNPARATPMVFTAHDPPPVERICGERSAPIVLACEHGGRAVPQGLQGNAPSQEDMARHIAYDIGAEMVARRVAKNLALPLVIQRYRIEDASDYTIPLFSCRIFQTQK